MEMEAASVNGVLTDDERHAVAAAYQLGLLLSSQWPDVAAHLLVQGAEGEAVAELAGVSRTESWVVDQLVPRVLSDLAIPELTASQAAEVIARLLGQVAVARQRAIDDFAVVRALARLGPGLDYPGGLIADATMPRNGWTASVMPTQTSATRLLTWRGVFVRALRWQLIPKYWQR